MSETMDEKRVFFNGINGATGEYLTPPMPVEQVAAAAQGQKFSQEQLDELNFRASPGATEFAVLPEYGDGSDLQKVGWGIIFPATAEAEQVDAILEAMEPLISLRKRQVGKNADKRFRILRGGDGFRWINGRPETKKAFLERHGTGDGPVDPNQLPFYLLIVGDPQSIPFQFQYEMDVQYAVGRIYFPRLEDYACYAQSVADSENSRVSLARKAVFFGTAHPGDQATEASAVNLIKPLHEYINVRSDEFELGWSSQLVEPKDASRSALLSLLGGSQTPALLFTASHGMAWPYNHPFQARMQGALLCQDWRGPGEKVTRQHFLAAEDLPETSNLTGSVVFHFACFGAGTPYWDEFAIAENKDRAALAVRPFLSPLPMRLLSNKGGGALAVIGHVERAWTHSFSQGKLQSQTQAYQSLLFQLMDGKPVGVAMDDMNVRYAQIASTLAYNLGELKYNKNFISQFELAIQWASTNDARGYAVMGDPAVRIAVCEPGAAEQKRPVINLVKHYSGALPVVFTPEALEPLSASERQIADAESQSLRALHGSFSITAVEEQPAAEEQPVDVDFPGPGPVGPVDLGPVDFKEESSVIEVDGQPAGGERAPSQQVALEPSGAAPAGQAGGGRLYMNAIDGLAVALEEHAAGQGAAFSGNLFDGARDKVNLLVLGLNSALVNLAQSMEKITNKATTLTVTTGVIEDLKNFDPEKAEPRFVTTISLDGDVKVFVPQQAAEIDETLLALHKEMVNQAMANRLAFIKALGETVTTLFATPKG